MPTSNRSKKAKETQNKLQREQSQTNNEMLSIYNPIITDVLNKETWDNILKEVKEIFNNNNYRELVKDATLKGSISGTQIGLGQYLAISSVESLSDYYLHTTYKGSTLSQALRENAAEAERVIANIVKKQLEAKTNWQILAKEITKKTNTVGDVAKVVGDLEKQGLDYIKGNLSLAEQKAFKSKIKKAQNYVDNLSPGNAPTKQLKKAYQNVISSVQNKESVVFSSAIDKAFKKKIDYNNERVSRTELSRAYSLSFQRQIEEDPDVIGYRFLLSPAHPIPDQCDLCANVNNGGGKGVYKKGDRPSVPVHPHCLCMLEPYVDRGQSLPKAYTQKAASEYLDGLDEKTRGKIIGVNNSKYKSRYSEGLEKKGVHPNSFPKRNMLPKSLITEGVSNG